MKRRLLALLSLVLLIGTTLPIYGEVNKVEAAEQSFNEDEITEMAEEYLDGFEIIQSDELESSFSVIEDDGERYEYETLVLNPDTDEETVQVNKYLLVNNKRENLVETSEELVNNSNEMVAMAKASCHGVTGGVISWKGTRATAYFDSCLTKKFVNIIDESQGATGAIAGLSAVIRNTTKLGKIIPYAGFVSSILWAAGYTIKKISGNGKYGIGFHMARNPITGKINKSMGIPWRQ